MGGEVIHRELSESIIGAAISVLNTLRPGLDEKHRTFTAEVLQRPCVISGQRLPRRSHEDLCVRNQTVMLRFARDGQGKDTKARGGTAAAPAIAQIPVPKVPGHG